MNFSTLTERNFIYVSQSHIQNDQSLDIKSGIPLHILGDYLGGIKDKANVLLHKSLGEDFSIDFEISDTDFSIPVKKSGTVFAKDILECSQGETALVKSALSLGITSRAFEQSDKKYNIICLDEIDAELDSDNRYKFLDILQEQLDSLGNRQTFMITHNDAWNAADIGVVLMPGASLDTEDEGIMMNKFVIKDLRKKKQ